MEDFKLPKTEQDLEVIIKKVQECSDKKKFGDALAICQHLILNEETELSGYRERAEVWQDMKQSELALEDMKKVVSLGSVEPVDYYNLGIAQLRDSEAKEAINTFTKAIALGDEHNSNYYTQSCRFHRAAAYLRIGTPNKAIEDCEQVEDGYKCFLPSEGMTTKEELLSKAKKQVA